MHDRNKHLRNVAIDDVDLADEPCARYDIDPHANADVPPDPIDRLLEGVQSIAHVLDDGIHAKSIVPSSHLSAVIRGVAILIGVRKECSAQAQERSEKIESRRQVSPDGKHKPSP
jgi:hypothetical protein